MIQVNATTHTKGGVTISTGSVLDVTPHFITRRNATNTACEYDVAFDVAIYKNLAEYESGKPVLVKDYMVEYNIGFTAKNVDIQSLTSVTDLLSLLKTHIEEGVGVGNTEIVYPYQ